MPTSVIVVSVAHRVLKDRDGPLDFRKLASLKHCGGPRLSVSDKDRVAWVLHTFADNALA